MALISSNPDDYPRISPPHEPETWFLVRPIRAGDIRKANEAGREIHSDAEVTFAVLPWVLLGWSYPVPVSAETVDELDTETLVWLLGKVNDLSLIREESEKKASKSSSSPGRQRLKPAAIPASSTI